MNTIARMPARERSDLFAETAERKALAEAIIEKDFWVCWVLKQLFSIDAFNGRLLFKGGTSLSKIFHAINRFSEDIDLAVDYAALSRIDARGGKAMRDAVQTGIDHLALTTHNERRVLVLITEGYDTSSKVSQGELLDRVNSSGVPIYCIGLLSEKDSQRQDAARLALNELADASGGLALYPKNVAEVESISRQIANEASKHQSGVLTSDRPSLASESVTIATKPPLLARKMRNAAPKGHFAY